MSGLSLQAFFRRKDLLNEISIFKSLVQIGTKSQIWDLVASTASTITVNLKFSSCLNEPKAKFDATQPSTGQISDRMANFASADDLLGAWDGLRMSTYTGLPPELRAHQRDALLWLHRDKHVLLCVGTGFYNLYRFCQ